MRPGHTRIRMPAWLAAVCVGFWALVVCVMWAVLLLTGCAPTPALKPVCPTLITYSAADQKALKAELDAHPDLPEVHRWLRGYVGLRDQARQCAVAR